MSTVFSFPSTGRRFVEPGVRTPNGAETEGVLGAAHHDEDPSERNDALQLQYRIAGGLGWIGLDWGATAKQGSLLDHQSG